MKRAISYFLFLAALFISSHSFAVETAALLPNAKQTFLDANGNPLTSGTVTSYVPNTVTLKTTWQDAAEATPNANPLTLDAAGRAIIYGNGSYRQVVKDRNGNIIWDQVTAATGTDSGTTIGDGDLVGTMKPWAGFVAPAQYLFAYGQEISRITYSDLLTAVTLIQPINCTSGSPTLSGLADTTQIPIGAKIEAACVAAGTTVVSKTGTTVVVSVNAASSISTNATFYPWGDGNGTTTFNVPDMRGRAIAGRDNMGGSAASRLTTTYFGANASAIGATGGNESHSIAVTQSLFTAGAVAANTLTPLIVPTVQPTITANIIIKVLPDVNSNVATGVFSIQGMTGVLTCGSGLICTGNVINTVAPSASVTNVATGWGLTGGPCTVTCTVSVATTNPAYQYGNTINAQLNATVATSALTVALKANDGTDGTATNPILIPFRNVTLSTGSPTWLALTSSLSLVVPSTATLGTANATPFRIWIAAVNDAGTIRLCVINTLSGINIFPLQGKGILTSLGTPVNAAQTFYCGSVVTAKAYTVLGYITYESGLATAGTWSAIPDVIQLYGPGVPLPGETVQVSKTPNGALISTAGTPIPEDDTIPQITEGNEVLTQTVTPVSSANILRIESQIVASAGAGGQIGIALFQDAVVNSLAATMYGVGAGNTYAVSRLEYDMLAATTSATTFRWRSGNAASNAIFLNGVAGNRRYGGVMNTYTKITEIQR